MKDKQRVGFLDEVRGFAIICMVVYHAAFYLKEVYKVKIPILFDNWFYYVWAVFAGSFIFISGIVCRYSRDNTKRGAQCFFMGMLVTFVTAIFTPELTILFGILHFMGISMMIFGVGEALWDFVPALVGLIISVLLLIFTWNIESGVIGIGTFSFTLPAVLYESWVFFPLGFAKVGSADYFPLFPWIFLFFAGAYFGVYVRDGACPKFFYSTRIRFLAAAGRHTIWIYLLHMPIITLVLFLIYGR
ncbi:MAG: DUF1624 domain-containing protein [Oscillospiraceae bacterium]|nr:DUF1624 domain-containing protein [Oscillospiraceae bacterium]